MEGRPVNVGTCIVATKQPLQLNEVRSDMYLLVELQVAEAGHGAYGSRGWLRIRLFDKQGRVIQGRFQSPFHLIPIRPVDPDEKVQKIPQYEASSLFFRVADIGLAPAMEQESDILPPFASSYVYRP